MHARRERQGPHKQFCVWKTALHGCGYFLNKAAVVRILKKYQAIGLSRKNFCEPLKGKPHLLRAVSDHADLLRPVLLRAYDRFKLQHITEKCAGF